MTYSVYILQSQADGSFYTGYTSDLNRRLDEHNSGKTRYTSKKRPWILFYSEEGLSKKDAIIRERFLKKQRNKNFYLSLKNEKT